MKRMMSRLGKIKTRLRVGFFLAIRQVKRSNKWTTILIISVMTLTFLNLVVISGILVGLIQGSVETYRSIYTSDVIISVLKDKDYIKNSSEVISIVKNLPWTDVYSARYIEGGQLQANYKEKTNSTDKINSAASQITGIDPSAEDSVTHLSKLVVEGKYLEPDDYDQVMLGSQLLKKYLPIDNPGFTALENVEVGSKIRVIVNGASREVTVKGIVKSKAGEIEMRTYFVDKQLRSIIGRSDYNVDEVAIKLKAGADPVRVRDALTRSGVGEYGKVQTYADAEPKFLQDIKNTFALLGNAVSSIGLIVACITIFIVIFINAITRRKFIGILKGIGIESGAIEYAYILQSIFYALVGTAIGFLIVFAFLKPFIAAHPIDFPFSDGILVATLSGTFLRAGILFVATFIAGYIPAKLVVRQNTLDAILGR